MRIVFMGSAELSCASLDALLASDADEVVGVVTQPDRPSGRGKRVAACHVKEHVGEHDIPVLTPDHVSDIDSVAAISELTPDVIAVVAYGQRLRDSILSMPSIACLNVHTSLLPKYRGAAPIQWAVANGDSLTGVTTMYMDTGMDTGDIILQEEVPIDPADTGGSLHDKLAVAGANLLVQTMDALRNGTATGIPQDDGLATVAPKLRKVDGRIDWTTDALDIYNRVRGFNPWPCCFCTTDDEPDGVLRVFKVAVEECGAGEPGVIMEWAGAGPLVRAGSGAVRLLEVQPAGKKVMDGRAYVNGYRSPGHFRRSDDTEE